MSYRDFDLRTVKQQLGVHIRERQGVFAAVPAVAIRPAFAELLAETVPLARGINTEKARSELIIAPMLVELRKQLQHRISLFSGIEFNVDKQHGLNGFCDFIISASPQQLMLNAPVIVIVEAKNENIISGLGQCIAEMVAAHCFNSTEQTPIKTLYGVVTTGTAWKFLTLEHTTVVIDLDEYMIDQPGKVLGILHHMLAALVAPNVASC
ncbi:hypothetical protein SAMN05421644_13214 [Allochromatium warmingii]|uniref:Type I restriction enzyme R protein N terminus (HSDR_N) n=1 Tax=Allochromatium warmingii TaxID=61595 RepID=A0A1H3HD54_ALLWA|nr:hypothetical protein [Allochromatium warmingii]SDY13145.1 hypothetical protein SAMN05421644_13214 [Allochromatium warmingii]